MLFDFKVTDAKLEHKYFPSYGVPKDVWLDPV